MKIWIVLLSPFIGMLYGLRNIRNKYSKYYFFCFILFYGFTFTIPKSQNNMDMVRRLETFNQVADNANLSFSDALKTSYSNDNSSASADPFEKILMLMVSRISDDQRVMLLTWSAILGLFIVYNIWFVIDKFDLRINRFNALWITMLFLIVPFWNINAFRFWVGAQIFIFGFLRYFDSNNRKYLLFACFSIFAHFSFISVVIIAVVGLFLPKNFFIANVVFVLTYLFGSIDWQLIAGIVDFLPQGINGKYTGYTSDSYQDRLFDFNNTAVNFYVKFRYTLLLIAFEAIILEICIRHKGFLDNKMNRNMMFLALCLLSFSNVVFDQKPLDRFFSVGAFFMICITLRFWSYSLKRRRLPILPKILAALPILYILVEVRIGFDTISITSIFGNPLSEYFLREINTSLIDLIK